MKRIFIILLSVLMILSLAACGSNNNGGKTEVRSRQELCANLFAGSG